MLSLGDFKRGDTFVFTAHLTDPDNTPLVLTAEQVRSQIRDRFGKLYGTLVVVAVDGVPGSFTLSTPNTVDWPCETLYLDIEMDLDGQIVSSPTAKVNVVKDVTRDE